jgi:transposase
MTRHLGYERRDPAKLEARRIAAMSRLQRGESTSTVARSLGVCIQSVQRWARCYRLHGNEGLRRSPKSGPRPKLARDKLIRLSDLLARGPLAYGFETPVWTSERVASLIWSRFRVRYSVDHVKRLLATMGWRWHEHTWLPPRSENFRSQTPARKHTAFPTVR